MSDEPLLVLSEADVNSRGMILLQVVNSRGMILCNFDTLVGCNWHLQQDGCCICLLGLVDRIVYMLSTCQQGQHAQRAHVTYV
jgi:hypothetical protein